jgi:hypothetical protein
VFINIPTIGQSAHINSALNINICPLTQANNAELPKITRRTIYSLLKKA